MVVGRLGSIIILGTFTPSEKVVIGVNFLSTLEERDMFSGVGEMLKVHAIDSPESFDKIATHYEQVLAKNDV
jgi:3-dehydroquinate synthase